MAVARMTRASDPRWLGSLVDTLMGVPDADGVSAATLAVAWRDARARLLFLHDVDVRVMSPAEAASVKQAIMDREILGVGHGGETLLPLFQFDGDGRPHPEMQSILRTLVRPAWACALWFHGRIEHLDDGRPMDLLWADPARVVTAAQRDALEAQRF